MKILNIEKLIRSKKETYNKYYNNLMNELIENYKNNIRNFTFEDESTIESNYKKDKILQVNFYNGQYEMTYGNLLSLLIIFKIFNIMYNDGIKIDNIENYVFDPSDTECFNLALDAIYIDYIDIDNIKELIFDRMSELAKVSGYFTSGTISLYDICKLKEKDKEMDKILNFKINEKDQPSKQIKDIKNNLKKLEEKLTVKDNSYRSLIKSGAGINMKQLSQVLNCIGPKPDTFGNLFPDPINTNFVNGLRNSQDFFINADNARKALIVNYTSVKDSGYLTRILSMLCLDTKLSDYDKCNTPVENYMNVYIKNMTTLKRYQHRNMWDEENQCLREVGLDESLIEKTIKVASPMTCSCKDGVCKTCYGNLHKTITKKKLSDGRTIKENIGMIAVLLLTERLTQRLLSTKHLLEAQTDKIEWGELVDYFEFISTNVMLKEEYSYKDIKITNYENDSITGITINNKEFTLPVEFNLNENYYSLERNDDDTYSIIMNENIDSNDIEDSILLFNFVVKNKELSRAVNAIKDLINTNEIKERDLNGNLNYMLDLLEEVGFTISSEHIEVILRELIVVNDRSEFTKSNPIYEQVRATEKVLKSSVIKSLLFERLESQLLNPATYSKNNEDSLLDFLL